MNAKIQTPPAEFVTMAGEIERIRFRGAEGWSVFALTGAETWVVGTLPEMCDVGSYVTCSGAMEDGKFGRQLKCHTVIPEKPDVSTAAGVGRLLERLPGIGPAKAAQAVKKFGHEEAWRLACEEPTKIGVRDFMAEKAKEIAISMVDGYEATVYLLGINLTDYQAGKVFREFGKNTIKVVSENPYRLLVIDGFGFMTVDRIALKAGIEVGNPARIRACIMHVLSDGATNGGHIWHNGWSLTDIVSETLISTAMRAEVSLMECPTVQDIRREAYHLAAEGTLVIDNGRVFNKALLRAEQTILEYLQ